MQQVENYCKRMAYVVATSLATTSPQELMSF